MAWKAPTPPENCAPFREGFDSGMSGGHWSECEYHRQGDEAASWSRGYKMGRAIRFAFPGGVQGSFIRAPRFLDTTKPENVAINTATDEMAPVA